MTDTQARLAALRQRLVALSVRRPKDEAAAPTIVVNVQLPSLAAELDERFGDGQGGLRTTDRATPMPG